MKIRKNQKPKEVSISEVPATIFNFGKLTIMDDATLKISDLKYLKDKLKG